MSSLLILGVQSHVCVVGSAKVLMRLAALAEVAEIMNNSDSDIPESSL
jgi:hypothetical protein